MKLSNILGLNARTQGYAYRYNSRRGKNVADSKIQTAKCLAKAQIPHPTLLTKFTQPGEIADFNWDSLPPSFALKPSRGLGGEGIVVVKKKLDNDHWLTTQRKKVSAEDLKLHALDILEGAFSMGNVPDVAFIQEYVGRHKAFRKYSFRGTPDIRVIVFNQVPVMAMLRLPTRESGGRANLHQGAIAVGIDIATGITTKAYWHGKYIKYKPATRVVNHGPFGVFKKTLKDETKRKLHGIKVPNWTTILETAVKAQMASGLGYVGVDIVLHPQRGPMVLELNAQPGLQVQMANMAGLKKRLERVEDLEVRDAEHGVKIAKALFAGRFSDRVAVEEGIKTIGTKEVVRVVGADGRKVEVWAKIDTGAWRSSIDRNMAKDMGLLNINNVLIAKTFKGSLGTKKRPIIALRYYLAGRKIDTLASVADRSKLRRPLIIGRRDLVGFLVKT